MMNGFKCINCGEIFEKKCFCTLCGYAAYELPYDRADVLRNEIKGFIKKLKIDEIFFSDMTFTGMEEDKNSFPDLAKIIKYVTSVKRSAEFFERLETSLSEIKKHISKSFSKKYKADMQHLKYRVSENNSLLIKALDKLGVVYSPEEFLLPEVKLDYFEETDNDLLEKAERVIDLAAGISEKLKELQKREHLYNISYSDSEIPEVKLSKEQSVSEKYEKIISLLEKALEKKYVIDILSDGTKEAAEMLGYIWLAIGSVMKYPVYNTKLVFNVGNEKLDGTESFNDHLIKIINAHYTSLDEIVDSDSFLAGMSEKSLFISYNKMKDIDDIGYFTMNLNKAMPVKRNERKLHELIGLSDIKESIMKIKAYALANKGSGKLNLHMCFYGNPGTGKTEVARIIAGILHENKILPTDKVVETDRSGLVGRYMGETPQKTLEVISEAMGGVLFIDEAYSLVQGENDYGHEAVATLIKAMEDLRGEFCVIFAGYKNKMLDMISSNPGFRSRIQFELDFPNYSRDELKQITELMLSERKYTASDEVVDKILDITDIKRKDADFANAREVRNILDQVIMCQNLRTAASGENSKEIVLFDVNKYIGDAKISVPLHEDKRKSIITASEELEALVGLEQVKRMIKKIRAYAKRNKDDSSFNLHMCFCGAPGTGKTETARILSRILFEAGVLPEAKLVETDASGLIASYVGQTASKTEKKIQEAMGGVLFIDEAYSLTDQGTNSYGDEAIAVLLKEMEDKRGKFCVILAGYNDEMEKLIASNPGFGSRIQFKLDFPDYDRDELTEIARVFLDKKHYEITDDALEKIVDIAEYYRRNDNFANARTIRNILDQVIMNQNLRTDDEDDEDNMIILSDVEDYIIDEGIDLSSGRNKRGKIGF